MRSATILLALTTAACGGNPAAPTAAPTPAASLQPGRYALALSDSVQTGGGTFCISAGTTPPVSAISLIGDAGSDGEGGLVVRVASGSDAGLTLRLKPSGAGVAGTIQGSAGDAARRQIVTVDGGSDATAANVSGSTLNATSAAGQVNGRVVFAGDGGTTSCSANTWSLNRVE